MIPDNIQKNTFLFRRYQGKMLNTRGEREERKELEKLGIEQVAHPFI